MTRIAAYLVVAVLALGCQHPIPNPGQIILSCAMDAVNDPVIVNAVLKAIANGDWPSAVASIIGRVPGATAEVIACVLQSFLTRVGADPAKAVQREHARAYLQQHGYEVP